MTRGSDTGPGRRAAPSARAARRRQRVEHSVLAGAGLLLLAFMAAPLLGLFATASFRDFVAGLQHPLVWPALRLSLITTSASLAVVVALGTPLAWVLARAQRATRLVETVLELPIVIPPAVAGIALLLAFGRRSLLGALYPPGWSLSFTTSAVVLAQVFVSAPFFVQAALSAFRRIDPHLLLVARSFGAHPLRVFARVGLPLAAPGLLAGALLSWARALGEFGATLMFAGNLEGKTQTLPLAIYTAMEADLRAAQSLSIVLVVLALLLLVGVRALLRSLDGGEVR
ncbi:MAG TPA: ABC transporter permease [Polyangiaceae bacterium]|nr:ABC transporter permease [Polyangiaceae bacterium]